MQAYYDRIRAGAGDPASVAAELDAADPLRAFRDEFHIPPHASGLQRYFCGNSLGLQPKAVRAALMDELDDWAWRATSTASTRGCPTTASCAIRSRKSSARSLAKWWR